MTQHWIFVLLPFSDYNSGNVQEIFRKAQTIGRWKLGEKTNHRNHLAKGDKILFYLAGEEGRKFLGIGELLSTVKNDDQKSELFVELGQVKLWKKQPRILDLIDVLSFIKNKKHYGLHLQGGIVAISEKDFKTVLNKAE